MSAIERVKEYVAAYRGMRSLNQDHIHGVEGAHGCGVLTPQDLEALVERIEKLEAALHRAIFHLKATEARFIEGIPFPTEEAVAKEVLDYLDGA